MKTTKEEKKYKKRYNIWHLFGSHKYTECIEYGDYGLGGETKIEFSSPWALLGTRYTRYLYSLSMSTMWKKVLDAKI